MDPWATVCQNPLIVSQVIAQNGPVILSFTNRIFLTIYCFLFILNPKVNHRVQIRQDVGVESVQGQGYVAGKRASSNFRNPVLCIHPADLQSTWS